MSPDKQSDNPEKDVWDDGSKRTRSNPDRGTPSITNGPLMQPRSASTLPTDPASVIQQAQKDEKQHSRERLRQVMQLIGQFERTALPLLAANNMDVVAAITAFNRDSEQRRQNLLARLERRGVPVHERESVLDRLEERNYLGSEELERLPPSDRVPSRPKPQETLPDEGILMNVIRLEGPPSLDYMINLISVLREVTGGTAKMLGQLLERSGWNGNNAYWAYLHNPNRVDFDGVRCRLIIEFSSDQQFRNIQSDMLFKFIEETGAQVDVALFAIRRSGWNLNRAKVDLNRLHEEFSQLVEEADAEIDATQNSRTIAKPNTSIEHNPNGLRLVTPTEEHRGRHKPNFPVQDWWSPDVPWYRAAKGQSNESYLWYLKNTRGGTKWHRYNKEIDWNSVKSRRALDHWRLQPRRRLGAPLNRPGAIIYLDPENQFIADRYLNAERERQQNASTKKRLIKMKEFVGEFNEKFAGKVIPGYENSGLRPRRTIGSIQSQASRLPQLEGILTILLRESAKKRAARLAYDGAAGGEGSASDSESGSESEQGEGVGGTGKKRQRDADSTDPMPGPSEKHYRSSDYVADDEEDEDTAHGDHMEFDPMPPLEDDDEHAKDKGEGVAR